MDGVCDTWTDQAGSSVWVIGCRPSVSRSKRCAGRPVCADGVASGAPQIQMPLVCAWTEEPMPKPRSHPASWLRMYDLPAPRGGGSREG